MAVEKKIFKTQYDKCERFTHREMTEEIPVYQASEDGLDVVITGYTNIQKEIDSYKEACLLENLIKEYSMDPSILADAGDNFVDFSELNTQLDGVITQAQYAKQYYDNLTDEQKALVGSFEQFQNTYMNLFVNKEEKKEEVKANE